MPEHVPKHRPVSEESAQSLPRRGRGRRVDLEVLKGECFGLLGPNGAGKTTTIEICEGLSEAGFRRRARLGHDVESRCQGASQRLGIQLQETQLADKLTVIETVRLFRSFFRQGPEPDFAIEIVKLNQNGTPG